MSVIHLLNELDDDYIGSMRLDGMDMSTIETHAGGTVRAGAAPSGAADSLDIRRHSLMEMDGVEVAGIKKPD